MRELFVVAEESTETLWVLSTHEGERFCIPREELVPLAIPSQPVTEGFDSGFDDDSENYEVVEAELVDEPADSPNPNSPAPPSRCTPPIPSWSQRMRSQRIRSSRPDLSNLLNRPSRRNQKSHNAPPPSLIHSLLPCRYGRKIFKRAFGQALQRRNSLRKWAWQSAAWNPTRTRFCLRGPRSPRLPASPTRFVRTARASETLFEVLALTFASRGHALAEAHWDAVREAGEPWVVRVAWQAGLQEHQAEWYFRRSMASGATTEPRDAVAADLIDPSFAQPVRSLSSVGHPVYNAPADLTEPTVDPRGYRDHRDYDDYAHQADLGPETVPQPHGEYNVYNEYDEHNAQPPGADHPNSRTQPNLFSEGEVLQQPDPRDKPQKRRRKAVTPHWEDVLLGVRTNTKRPK